MIKRIVSTMPTRKIPSTMPMTSFFIMPLSTGADATSGCSTMVGGSVCVMLAIWSTAASVMASATAQESFASSLVTVMDSIRVSVLFATVSIFLISFRVSLMLSFFNVLIAPSITGLLVAITEKSDVSSVPTCRSVIDVMLVVLDSTYRVELDSYIGVWKNTSAPASTTPTTAPRNSSFHLSIR